MCFSANASFLASALLLPTGLVTLSFARAKGEQQKLPLATAPLLFGFQQICEGILWLGLQDPTPLLTTTRAAAPVVAALVYLFFAYVFWPIWMPWAAVAQLPSASLAQTPLWRGLPLLGLIPAVTLWLPLLQQPHAALPEPVGHSLVYPLMPWSSTLLPPHVGPLLYASLIVLPFLLVPSRRVLIFALSLLLTFGLAEWSKSEALTSVWCYASALLSMQILWVLQESKPAPEQGGGKLA